MVCGAKFMVRLVPQEPEELIPKLVRLQVRDPFNCALNRLSQVPEDSCSPKVQVENKHEVYTRAMFFYYRKSKYQNNLPEARTVKPANNRNHGYSGFGYS